jgi:hypothetical protein
MVYQHRFQASRYELKYIIDERCAGHVRDYIRSYLVPDEHADPEAGSSYPVHSLYLDSPALALFRSTVDGLKNRFKLRIRFYDDDPAHPVFVEIKRRLSDVICKERAGVHRVAMKPLLRGMQPSASSLIDSPDRHKAAAALQTFCRTGARLAARGCVYISYQREAYVSPDTDQIRVTFDRCITVARYCPKVIFAVPKTTTPVDMSGVVLEMKFTERFPNWMRQMVHALNLVRSPSAKYVAGVHTIGYPWVEGIGRELGVAS